MACRFIWYIPLGTTSGNPSKWNRRGWMLERESETKKITLNFRRHSSLPWLLIPCNEIILTFYHIMKLLIETKVVVICHCDYFWAPFFVDYEYQRCTLGAKHYWHGKYLSSKWLWWSSYSQSNSFARRTTATQANGELSHRRSTTKISLVCSCVREKHLNGPTIRKRHTMRSK